MEKTKEIIQRLTDFMIPNRAAPVLGKVLKAYEGPGNTAYSVDVRIIKAGSLEETEQVFAEVPVSPIWVGKSGKGLYAIPPENSIVIVGFIEWNISFPYIAGVWSDNYNAGEFKKGQIVITDGNGLKLGVDIDSLFLFETKHQSLKSILNELIDEISAIKTQGPPPTHMVSPVSVQKLKAIKTRIAQLLK
ncbi:MAG: hypothetical protein JXB88_26055 [Spirochaetales bacterium]|nr:hypothetical protein [Spirochaetales bacterium]